jgi:hypothetical protein
MPPARKNEELHNPEWCRGCGNAGNIMIGDTGVMGCNALVGCAIKGPLTWGHNGHHNYMKACEHRFVCARWSSDHTIVGVNIVSKRNPGAPKHTNYSIDNYRMEDW